MTRHRYPKLGSRLTAKSSGGYATQDARGKNKRTSIFCETIEESRESIKRLLEARRFNRW
jgi:hypothetical protein